MAKQSVKVRVKKDGRFEKRFSIHGKMYYVAGRTVEEVEEKERNKRAEIKELETRSTLPVSLGNIYEILMALYHFMVEESAYKCSKCPYKCKYTEGENKGTETD